MKKHGWYRNKGKETPSREIYINKEGVETAGFLLFSHLGDGFQFSLCRAPNLMDVEMNGHVCAFIVVPGARTDPDSAGREDEMHEIKQYERKGSIICSVFFSWNWRRLKISTFIFCFCRGYNSKKGCAHTIEQLQFQASNVFEKSHQTSIHLKFHSCSLTASISLLWKVTCRRQVHPLSTSHRFRLNYIFTSICYALQYILVSIENKNL